MSIISLMCRICEKKFHLIDISIASNQHYLNMFLACADVTFRSDDKLPKHFCRLCALRLVHFYEFKQKCEQTQKKLEDQSSNVEKNCRSPLAVNNKTNVQEDTDSITEEDSNKINDTDEFRSNDSSANELPKLKDSRRAIRFKCGICRKSYKLKFGLEHHLMARHNMAENRRQCEYCDKSFAGRKYYRHLAKHEKSSECEICKKRFSFRENMIRHIKEVHEKQKLFKCAVCGLAFGQNSYLKRHIAQVHEHQRPFVCTWCGSAFGQNSSLTTHISQVHLKQYNFHCNTCNKSYKLKAELKDHEITHLPEAEQQKMPRRMPSRRFKSEPIVCEYCGILCKNYYSHYCHIKTHATGQLFKCDLCGKAFKTKNTLYTHNMIHTKERKFKCDTCDLAFLSCSKLKYHKMVHTGEKPFKCEFCGKAFLLKGNCATHRRLHTGEKPFKCEQCTECFIDLNGLKRHCKKNHIS